MFWFANGPSHARTPCGLTGATGTKRPERETEEGVCGARDQPRLRSKGKFCHLQQRAASLTQRLCAALRVASELQPLPRAPRTPCWPGWANGADAGRRASGGYARSRGALRSPGTTTQAAELLQGAPCPRHAHTVTSCHPGPGWGAAHLRPLVCTPSGHSAQPRVQVERKPIKGTWAPWRAAEAARAHGTHTHKRVRTIT